MAKEDYLFTLSNGKLSEAQVNALNKSDYLFSINKHFTPEEKVPFTGLDNSSLASNAQKIKIPEVTTAINKAQTASTSLLDKYRASFVQKTPQELATNPVSKFFQGVSSGFISGAVDVVRGAGTIIEAGVGKIADDIKTGRFVDNLTKVPGDTQALKDDWSRFIDKRKETKIDETLAPAISTIRQGMVQDSKAAQAGSFVGGAGAYATLAGASGLVGVAPLFLSSLDNSISTIEAEGKDIKTLDAMARAFGTAAVEVGTEYLFNVLGGMGSKGAAIAARSTIGRSALSRVTGLYDNMAIKASSMFGKFVAATPNPTLTKYVSFLFAKGNEEGFEELASYIGSGMIQLWTTDKDKKPSEVMNAKDAATNYLLGGVMGFAISAVNNVDGLLAAMPQSKAKIDSISNKPITEVTADEMSDVINTIAEEGQAPVVQNITSQMTQKAASVAETVNATADTEYAEEIAKPIEQATATAQINVDETLASIDSNIEEFINTQQDAPSDWKAEFMRKFSLQHLALKSLAQRIDMEAPEGKRLSEHIRKLEKLISSRVANPRIRNLVEEYLSDKYIFHNIVTDQMAEDEARTIPTDELGWKRLYKRLGNSQYAPTKAEAIVVYDEMTRLMSLTNPTDAEIATLGKLEQIVMKKSSLAGSALQAWSYIAKRTPEYEASMIIKKAEPMFDTAKTKQGREVVDGLVDDSKKARKKAADDTADKIQKDIDESEPVDVVEQEKKNIPTSELLARLIKNRLNWKEKPAPQNQIERKIVRALYDRFAETIPSIPKKAKPTDDDLFQFVGIMAYDNKTINEIWEDAQKVIADVDTKGYNLDEFMEIINPLYNEKLVRKLMLANLKSMGINIRDMMRAHFSLEDVAFDSFSAVLRNNLEKNLSVKISDADFAYLDNMIRQEMETSIENEKIKMVVAFHKKLEKMFSKKVSADDRNRAIAELTDMAMSNAFDEPLIADSWKNRLGIKDFTNEMRERIHETLRQIAVLKLNNGDQDEINKLYDDMIHDIAKSAPAEMKEKYSSFRRMAMLLNPGTWVRNSVANNVAAAFYGVSDRMQMFAEGKLRIPSEYRRFSGQLIDVKGDSDIANVVKIRATDKSMTRSMRRSAKYGIESAVGYEKNIFDNATLQAINDFSKHILSGDFEGNRLKVLNFLGDKPVYEHHYRVAMANSLSAQGYSESLSPVAKEQMIQQAMEVAENVATRRVFRQMNWVSQKLLNLKKTNKVADAVISVMQPFIITPTAVAYEAYRFSPVALAVETGKLIASGISNKGIQNIPVETRMKIAESLPQALTGTVGQVVIGYLLASFGFLTAGWPDSEKEREQWKLQGKSPYSLYIPNVGSFSIDWAQPVAVGITMGAQFQQSKGDPSKISEAMFNSLLGGSIIENFTKSYGKDVWTSIAVDTATDGIIQNFPTLLKKVGDSIDPFERDVYQGSALNILGNRALSYIPGGSYLIPAKVDVWGNPIQKTQTEGVAGAAVRTVRALLLPFTVKESNMDDTTRKVYDVFKASGKSDALPKVAPQKFTYNKVDYELDGKEYVLFQQELGTRSKSLVDSVINKPEFDEMSPELQAKVLARMYSRALEQAKATIVQKIS